MKLPCCFLLVIGMACATTSQGQSLYGTNLIYNGDAEAGAGAMTGGTVPVPGWAVTGAFTAAAYGGTSAAKTTDSGPLARGTNHFAGGPTSTDSMAFQEVSLSAVATDIDFSEVKFCLAGYFGGYQTQDDNAALMTRFLTGADVIISSNAIGGLLAIDRTNRTGLFLKTLHGSVPPGTRKVQFFLQMNYSTGTYSQAWADNLSFVLFTTNRGPGLVIEPTQTNALVSWPTSLTGFSLESSPGLTQPASWTSVTNALAVTTNGSFVATNNLNGQAKFFRLRFP